LTPHLWTKSLSWCRMALVVVSWMVVEIRGCYTSFALSLETKWSIKQWQEQCDFLWFEHLLFLLWLQW
jgi:hypothetical protein